MLGGDARRRGRPSTPGHARRLQQLTAFRRGFSASAHLVHSADGDAVAGGWPGGEVAWIGDESLRAQRLISCDCSRCWSSDKRASPLLRFTASSLLGRRLSSPLVSSLSLSLSTQSSLSLASSRLPVSLEINKVMYTRYTLYARVLTLAGPTERDILPMRDYTRAPLTRAPHHNMFCNSYSNKYKKQAIIFLRTWKKIPYEKLVEHPLKITRVLMERETNLRKKISRRRFELSNLRLRS